MNVMKKLVFSIIILSAAAFTGCDMYSAALNFVGTSAASISDGIIEQPVGTPTTYNEAENASAFALKVNFTTGDSSPVIEWTELSSHGITIPAPTNTATSTSVTLDPTGLVFQADEAAKLVKIRCTVTTGVRKRDYDFSFYIYDPAFTFIKPNGTGDGSSPLQAAGATMPDDINDSPDLKIAVMQGTYDVEDGGTGRILIGPGQYLYGGYSSTWQRDASRYTTIIRDTSTSQNESRTIQMGGSSLLDGFTVISGTGGVGSWSAAIYSNRTTATIKNCVIKAPPVHQPSSAYRLIMIDSGATDNTIENNVIQASNAGTSVKGIYVDSVSGTTISGNDISISNLATSSSDTVTTSVYGIYSSGVSGTFTITDNNLTFSNNSSVSPQGYHWMGLYIGGTAQIDIQDNVIDMGDISTTGDTSGSVFGIRLTSSVYGTISGNTVSIDSVSYTNLSDVLSVKLLSYEASTANASTISNNIFNGPAITISRYTGSNGLNDQHLLYGLHLHRSPSGALLSVSDNEIYTGSITRGNSSNYYVEAAGIYSVSTSGDIHIERNIIQGPQVSTGNPIDYAVEISGITADADAAGNEFYVFNNLVYGGSLNASGSTDSFTSGISVKGDMDYCMINNTIASGDHPDESFVVYTDVTNNAAVILYNNIYLSTGSATRRVVLHEENVNINGCWTSLFTDVGSGGSFIFVHDNTFGDVTSISGTVGFTQGSVPLNVTSSPAFNNKYYSGSAGLFVNYAGADGNALTLSDNNWQLADTAPASAQTGANSGGTVTGIITDDSDFTGPNVRDSGWSMGAYEYVP